MLFKFEANQDYQVRAIEAVAGLFEGQQQVDVDLAFSLTGFAAVANRLDLPPVQILENLQVVQQQNGIALDKTLQQIQEKIETVDGRLDIRFPNFSVEMETGTGKTYVYLRTVLELFRRYGMRKFIVVVHSVAVREGVLKTLQVTKKHLQELYENPPYRYYAYDSASLSQVRQFALSDGIEIMVMTIDSFNKASNVINQATDRLQGETPIHLVRATHPILILDEPQNMESELRVRALAALNPLFALRYSATHRNPYSLVYRLTPVDAYRQRLVKRIEVASVLHEDDPGQVFVRLDDIRAEKRTVSAKLTIKRLMTDGAVRDYQVTVRPGDSLATMSARPEYAGYEVSEINPGSGFIRFANNVELTIREARGADKDAIFEAQIRYTVEEHFRKQARLEGTGIKVLSLFFIDRVANYAPADGIIRRLFVKAFDELKQRYPAWADRSAETVQAAYFAQRRTKSGEVLFEDTKSGETDKDKEAYDLIMRDKERLLSFAEPVAFIFSHSALREGWDNPNVFQICTLNQTSSEVKKRQEVGRGVRLPVDQDGERVHDENINVLTVVANESYERYVEQLQSEIAEDYGLDNLPPPPANARERGVARLRKEFTLRPEFQELWERIKQRTRYTVTVDTEALITAVVQALDQVEVRPPRISVAKAEVTVGTADQLMAVQLTATQTALEITSQEPLPNLVSIMENLMERTTPPARLTRKTLLEILRRTRKKREAMANPSEFATIAVRLIKEHLADQLVSGIQYEKIDEWYEMSRLEAEIESWAESTLR